jgi:hypothetical protein
VAREARWALPSGGWVAGEAHWASLSGGWVAGAARWASLSGDWVVGEARWASLGGRESMLGHNSAAALVEFDFGSCNTEDFYNQCHMVPIHFTFETTYVSQS